MNTPTTVLRVQDLTVHYVTRHGHVSAVDNVSFALGAGEALGLVGESGSGKTSIALAILKLLPDNARILDGHAYMDGVDLVPLEEEEMRRFRWRRISMVFQAAMSSLDPVYRVGDQVVEAITAHQKVPLEQAGEQAAALFQMVGLEPRLMRRYPHELSGGMKQRVVIAMALACRPKVIIADEPTTALDVIVQDHILRELRKVQRETGTAMLYISHDIAVVAETCARIGIMYAGKLVELAETPELFTRPVHPYTEALLGSTPSIQGEKRSLASLSGEPPNLLDPPPGCRFHPRCPHATEVCRTQEPQFQEHRPGHWAACWHPLPERKP